MFTVIAFDVSDDRTRTRVVKRLRAVAVRVQKSVFEAGEVRPHELARLERDLEELVDLATDRVRYYSLCAACVERTRVTGRGDVTRHPEFEVI